MGGKSRGKEAADMALAAQYMSASQMKQLMKETQPLRESYYGAWQDIMSGKMPFGETVFPQMLSSARGPIEEQYGTAKENVLSTIPEGGSLYEALGNVETGRAQGLQDLISQYLMDQLNKMYGVAFQAPQTSIAGLQGVMNLGASAGAGAAQGAASAGQACCFNFLEAEGEIYHTVRRYRDEYYSKKGLIGVGYLMNATIFVPLMRKYKWFKRLIRNEMTRPLKYYSQWYYGEDKIGFIFWPIKVFWTKLWGFLGWIKA